MYLISFSLNETFVSLQQITNTILGRRKEKRKENEKEKSARSNYFDCIVRPDSTCSLAANKRIRVKIRIVERNVLFSSENRFAVGIEINDLLTDI